jgi:hypothetical protein
MQDKVGLPVTGTYCRHTEDALQLLLGEVKRHALAAGGGWPLDSPVVEAAIADFTATPQEALTKSRPEQQGTNPWSSALDAVLHVRQVIIAGF